jgi:hypothetical protein
MRTVTAAKFWTAAKIENKETGPSALAARSFAKNENQSSVKTEIRKPRTKNLAVGHSDLRRPGTGYRAK